MMWVQKLSIKALTISNLATIGVAAVVLSIIVGSMFHKAALTEETRVLKRIVEVASAEVIKKLDDQTKDLGASAEKADGFRGAVTGIESPENRELVVTTLNDQFSQRFVTSGILRLNKIRVYDTDFNFLAESSQGVTGLPRKLPDFLLEQAKPRKGGDRLKALSGLWGSDKGAMYSMLVPVGGLSLKGYLEVVADPTYDLQHVAHILKTLVRLTDAGTNKVVFKSENWPENTLEDTLIINYEFPDANGKTAVNVEVLENIEKFNASFSNTQYFNVGAFVVITILGIIFTLAMFNRFVFKPLRDLMGNMERASGGDLSMQITPNGLQETQVLGKALLRLVENLRKQVTEIHSNAGQLSTAAEELSIVTGETSQGVQKQQSETDQVATAINEMSATVQEVARHAEAAADAARGADLETSNGKDVVTKTVAQINLLASDIERATNVIHKLEEDSENIGSVMDVIRGIAEQTNLLALNAAIEAARAGEQGRGFAVVADEVRVLASRTQKSTQEIQAMIERLQSGAQEAVKAMQESKERAQTTVEQAAKAGESLETITEAVANINNMNSQIASAAEEQSAVSEEINKSITNISQVAEKTAEGANHTARASETLAQLALKLQNVVSQFKV